MALETPMVTEKMIEAAARADAAHAGRTFEALSGADKTRFMERAKLMLEAALSTDAEPVAWYWEDATGCFHITLDRSDVVEMAKTVGCTPKPLFAGLCDTSRFFKQPAPSVVVEALIFSPHSVEMLMAPSIVGDYVIGKDGHWWLRGGMTLKATTIEEAKAAAQADYEARIRSALSAQVQDVP